MGEIVRADLNELLGNCGAIDKISWQAPALLSYEDWEEIGRRFQYVRGSLNWWLGDWLNEGERRYGETYTQAVESTDHTVEYLKNCKWVAGRVKRSTRVDYLSWTHHRYVAHLDEADQVRWLRRAANEDLSSRELHELIRQETAPPVQETAEEPEEDMTIKNPEAFMAGVWDWALLDGCFGDTKIRPTDIDGCVERNGQFLWLEAKAPGAPVPTGQRIVLERLAKRGDTVFILHGDRGTVEHMKKLTPFGETEFEANNDTCRGQVTAWFRHADGPLDPKRVARVLWNQYGPAFVDEMTAEFVKIGEETR